MDTTGVKDPSLLFRMTKYELISASINVLKV